MVGYVADDLCVSFDSKGFWVICDLKMRICFIVLKLKIFVRIEEENVEIKNISSWEKSYST